MRGLFSVEVTSIYFTLCSRSITCKNSVSLEIYPLSLSMDFWKLVRR